MILGTRHAWTRTAAGIVAALAAVATIATGGVAHADDSGDLELTLSAPRIALGEPFRDFRVTVTNRGPGPARGWHVEYDLGGLDDEVVTVEGRFGPGCRRRGERLVCAQPATLGPGHSRREPLPFTLAPVGGRHGPAGSIGVAIVSRGDPAPANNTASVGVEVPAVGVDLVVRADDVRRVTEDGEPTNEPVPPGEASVVTGMIGNLGDTVAVGLRVRVTLPRYVTFAEVEPGCVYTADNRTATCDYHQLALVPIGRVGGGGPSAVGVYFPVRVAEDAPGPMVAEGGELYAAALATTDGRATAGRARGGGAPGLPPNIRVISTRQVEDADPTDNTDEFVAYLAGPPDGGTPEPGTGAGVGLPVTGVRAGLVGGLGTGLLLVGGVLVFLSRRRATPTRPGGRRPVG
jgi:hypothetical protein